MARRYCSPADVYALGVPPGALVCPARVVSAADPDSDRLEIEGHGLADGQAVTMVTDPGGSLPSPLDLLTVYFVRLVEIGVGLTSDSMIQLAATVGGAAIDLTDPGNGSFRLAVGIGLSLEAEIEAQSRWFDSLITGHQVPLEDPIPQWVKSVVAKRTAASMVRQLRLGDMQSILDEAEHVTRDVLRMASSGLSLRDSAATPPANLAMGRSPQSSGAWSGVDRLRLP